MGALDQRADERRGDQRHIDGPHEDRIGRKLPVGDLHAGEHRGKLAAIRVGVGHEPGLQLADFGAQRNVFGSADDQDLVDTGGVTRLDRMREKGRRAVGMGQERLCASHPRRAAGRENDGDDHAEIVVREPISPIGSG